MRLRVRPILTLEMIRRGVDAIVGETVRPDDNSYISILFLYIHMTEFINLSVVRKIQGVDTAISSRPLNYLLFFTDMDLA